MIKLSLEQFNRRYYFSGRHCSDPAYCIIDAATGSIAHMLTGYVTGTSREKHTFFLAGIVCEPSQVFETLTDEEKEEAIWELDQWK